MYVIIHSHTHHPPSVVFLIASRSLVSGWNHWSFWVEILTTAHTSPDKTRSLESGPKNPFICSYEVSRFIILTHWINDQHAKCEEGGWQRSQFDKRLRGIIGWARLERKIMSIYCVSSRIACATFSHISSEIKVVSVQVKSQTHSAIVYLVIPVLYQTPPCCWT